METQRYGTMVCMRIMPGELECDHKIATLDNMRAPLVVIVTASEETKTSEESTGEFP